MYSLIQKNMYKVSYCSINELWLVSQRKSVRCSPESFAWKGRELVSSANPATCTKEKGLLNYRTEE